MLKYVIVCYNIFYYIILNYINLKKNKSFIGGYI